MIKTLRNALMAAAALFCGSTQAQEVTLDFTSQANWDIPTSGSANTALASFTDGTNTIQLFATNNYKLNNGYLIYGKAGSYLQLPAFDFDVEKIEVVGTSGASAAVVQNVFVGDVAVSTATTGAKDVTNVYEIAESYQAAGNIYKLQVTSNHNTQVSKLFVYKKGGVTKISTTVTIDETGLTNKDLANGTAAGKLAATVMAGETALTSATVTWSSSNESVATIDAQGNVTLVAAGTTTFKADYAGDDTYAASYATCELTVENSAYQLVGNGTLESPFTASDAIWLANNGEYADEECYIKGIVFKVNTTDANITQWGNIDYFISEDGQEANPSFEIFRGKYFDDAKFTVDNKVQVGDEVIVKGKLAMYNTQAETAAGAVLVKLVRDGQEVKPGEEVNAPTISGEASFEESVTVTITADEGCTIYYTLDGNDPTIESTQYTEPFTLTETTTVKAIAVKGESVSEVATATFTKTEPLPEEGIVFDFNEDYTTLFGIDEVTSVDNVHNFEASTNSATVEGVFVTVSAADEGVTNANRIWNKAPRLRLYSGYIKFTSETNKIERITMTRTTNKSLIANQNTADSGELTTSDQQNNAEVTWIGQAGSVKITIAGNTQISKAVVYLGDVPTGISTVSTTTGTKAIYNLAGQRVAEGYKGIVVVEGKKMIVK